VKLFRAHRCGLARLPSSPSRAPGHVRRRASPELAGVRVPRRRHASSCLAHRPRHGVTHIRGTTDPLAPSTSVRADRCSSGDKVAAALRDVCRAHARRRYGSRPGLDATSPPPTGQGPWRLRDSITEAQKRKVGSRSTRTCRASLVLRQFHRSGRPPSLSGASIPGIPATRWPFGHVRRRNIHFIRRQPPASPSRGRARTPI